LFLYCYRSRLIRRLLARARDPEALALENFLLFSSKISAKIFFHIFETIRHLRSLPIQDERRSAWLAVNCQGGVTASLDFAFHQLLLPLQRKQGAIDRTSRPYLPPMTRRLFPSVEKWIALPLKSLQLLRLLRITKMKALNSNLV
jgi:hypothetical protein